MEDDRVSLLEQQLAQAKLIAEEADKKYEEVGHVRRRKKGPKGPSFPVAGDELPISGTTSTVQTRECSEIRRI